MSSGFCGLMNNVQGCAVLWITVIYSGDSDSKAVVKEEETNLTNGPVKTSVLGHQANGA